jgi:hypothetical protein
MPFFPGAENLSTVTSGGPRPRGAESAVTRRKGDGATVDLADLARVALPGHPNAHGGRWRIADTALSTTDRASLGARRPLMSQAQNRLPEAVN